MVVNNGLITIPLSKGKLREIEEKDVRKLTSASRRRDIKKFCFIEKGNLLEYWQHKAEMNALFREDPGTVRQAYDFLIEEGGEMVGSIGLELTPFGFEEGHLGEVSYFVLGEYRRRGYASAALDKIIELSFNGFGVYGLGTRVLSSNLPSISLLESRKFRVEGVSHSDGKMIFIYGLENIASKALNSDII